MKTGLILEGGGVRGAYIAGILDVFIKEGIEFDYACGVSAGAGALFNFISKQEGGLKNVFLCPQEDSYYGFREFLRSGKFMNVKKVYGKMAYEKADFDFETFFASKTEVEVVATDCVTGKADYLTHNGTEESFFDIGRATSSLPLICGPYRIGNKFYMDGSVSDPIPVKRALEKGCEKVIVLSTKADGMEPADLKKYTFLMKLMYPGFGGFIDSIQVRVPHLLSQYELVDKMAEEGITMVYHPRGHWDVSHMDKDVDKIRALYEEGIREANERIGETRDFLKLS